MNSTALAILNMLLELSNDLHSHRCPRCQYIWEHNDESAGVYLAHCCPMCGTEQFTRYTGLRKPQSWHGFGRTQGWHGFGRTGEDS